MKQRVVIALGGNAIQNKGEKGTYEEQMKNVEATMSGLMKLIDDENYEVVITHGNGPQVGTILIQNAAGKAQVPEMPMFMCGAMSQGQIGYLIQQALCNLLQKAGVKKTVATVVTQVEVSKTDPAFERPSKPVGPFYSKAESESIAASNPDHVFKEDAGRGYRRVVPSPEPLGVIEIEAIRRLFENDVIVVSTGGGGIPVFRQGEHLHGVDAVIDKDKGAALLGDLLQADVLIILTAVKKVAINFGKPEQKDLAQLTLAEAKQYLKDGHFAEGSMGPKIEAAIKFVEGYPDRKTLITQSDVLFAALEGKDGTWISN